MVEKWTQRHARLHGNTANKMARILSGHVPSIEAYFYLFISLQCSSPAGSGPGKKISAKIIKPNPENIYKGINHLEFAESNNPGLSEELDC